MKRCETQHVFISLSVNHKFNRETNYFGLINLVRVKFNTIKNLNQIY